MGLEAAPAASDIWTKLSAIGTLTASFVALTVACGPLLRRRWLRPKLEVHTADHEPWARLASLIGPGESTVWLRIEVKNTGRTEARNVRALVNAWYERPDKNAQWEKRDLDPSALHWVSMPPNASPQGASAPAVNLPATLADFADLITYTITTGKHFLVVDDPTPRGFEFRPSHSTGEYVVTITIVADNADSVTRHVHYSLSPNDLFSEVRFDAAPPTEYRFTGLLADIQRYRAAQQP